MRIDFLCISVLRVVPGSRVKLASCKSALTPLLNSVRIKAPNSVNASKRKHKNQINHTVTKTSTHGNSTVCQSK